MWNSILDEVLRIWGIADGVRHSQHRGISSVSDVGSDRLGQVGGAAAAFCGVRGGGGRVGISDGNGIQRADVLHSHSEEEQEPQELRQVRNYSVHLREFGLLLHCLCGVIQ